MVRADLGLRGLMSKTVLLLDMYEAMLAALGKSGWWPASSSFETIVGAVLTQNTNWQNVEKALCVLREQNLLDPWRMEAVEEDLLAEYIRSSGYYRLKAGRLKNVVSFLRDSCDFDLDCLVADFAADELREKLLAIKGVGPETADTILLYALDLPFFVVDAYTFRIMNRHGLVPEQTCYEELQAIFTENLPSDASLFNEYHALLVRVGKSWCLKKKPVCENCPLQSFL